MNSTQVCRPDSNLCCAVDVQTVHTQQPIVVPRRASRVGRIIEGIVLFAKDVHGLRRAACVVLAEFELWLTHLAKVSIKIQLQHGPCDYNSSLFKSHSPFCKYILAFLSVDQMPGADHLTILAQFNIATCLQLIASFRFNMLCIDEGRRALRCRRMLFERTIHLQW